MADRFKHIVSFLVVIFGIIMLISTFVVFGTDIYKDSVIKQSKNPNPIDEPYFYGFGFVLFPLITLASLIFGIVLFFKENEWDREILEKQMKGHELKEDDCCKKNNCHKKDNTYFGEL